MSHAERAFEAVREARVVTDAPSEEDVARATSVACAASGGSLLSVESLAGGNVHTVLRVTTTTDDLVVRIERTKPPDWHPSQDGQLAAMRLAAQVGVPVPTTVAVEPGMVVHRHVVGRCMVDSDSVELAREAGRAFGRLHAVHGEGLGPVQADGSDPDWPEQTFLQSVPEEVASLRTLHDRLDLELIDAAVALIERLRPTLRSRLVHGDASPSNVIVHRDQVVALIDFEAAWFADPAIDMAWWWWNAPATAQPFRRACEEVSEPTDDHRLWVHRARLLIGIAATFARDDVSLARRINTRLDEAVGQLRLLT